MATPPPPHTHTNFVLKSIEKHNFCKILFERTQILTAENPLNFVKDHVRNMNFLKKLHISPKGCGKLANLIKQSLKKCNLVKIS